MNRGEEATYFVRFASVFFHKITFPSFYAEFVFHVFGFKNGILEELHVIVKQNLFTDTEMLKAFENRTRVRC